MCKGAKVARVKPIIASCASACAHARALIAPALATLAKWRFPAASALALTFAHPCTCKDCRRCSTGSAPLGIAEGWRRRSGRVARLPRPLSLTEPNLCLLSIFSLSNSSLLEGWMGWKGEMNMIMRARACARMCVTFSATLPTLPMPQFSALFPFRRPFRTLPKRKGQFAIVFASVCQRGCGGGRRLSSKSQAPADAAA